MKTQAIHVCSCVAQTYNFPVEKVWSLCYHSLRTVWIPFSSSVRAKIVKTISTMIFPSYPFFFFFLSECSIEAFFVLISRLETTGQCSSWWISPYGLQFDLWNVKAELSCIAVSGLMLLFEVNTLAQGILSLGIPGKWVSHHKEYFSTLLLEMGSSKDKREAKCIQGDHTHQQTS